MPTRKSASFSLPALITTVALTAAPAVHAGPIEDAFRGFLDRLRGQGQALRETPLLQSTREVKTRSLDKRTDKLPLGEREVAVFVDNGCRSCKGAVEDLRKRGFNVEVFNLSTSQTARQTFALTGAKGVPAVLLGSKVLSGYSPDLLKRALVEQATESGNAMQGQGS